MEEHSRIVIEVCLSNEHHPVVSSSQDRKIAHLLLGIKLCNLLKSIFTLIHGPERILLARHILK